MSLIRKLKFKIMEKSRQKKLGHFYGLCPEGASVLDVGVSQETKMGKRQTAPSRNLFLKKFRYKPEHYTGLGVQDLSGMDQIYPGKTFVTYPGGRFPFKDNEFDWVFSNAVIEHVGDDNAQVEFLSEMMRVGKKVFFTTPYKYFPVESHSDVLFLHWNNRLFYSWCKKYKPSFKKENLYLFSGTRLKSIIRQAGPGSHQLYKNRTLGMTMTFTVVCSR